LVSPDIPISSSTLSSCSTRCADGPAAGQCCDATSITALGSCTQLGQEGCCGGNGSASYCQKVGKSRLRGSQLLLANSSSMQPQTNASSGVLLALDSEGPPFGCTSWIEIQPNQDNSCSSLAAGCGIDLNTLYQNNGNLQEGNRCNVLQFGEFVCCHYR